MSRLVLIAPRRSAVLRRVGLGEWLVLLALAAWTLVPVVVLIARAAVRGGVFTGDFGVDPYDGSQYLSWVRDSGQHLLGTNLLGLSGGHVFLQPMWLLSGVLWRLGLGLQVAYLLWAPVGVFVLWAGFALYARRMEGRTARGLAVLCLGLCFATPIQWFSLPSTHWVAEVGLVVGDATPAFQPWLAIHSAVAIGLCPLVLLGGERILTAPEAPSPRSRLVVATAVAAALASWVHSWQGEAILLVLAAAAAWPRPRRARLVLLVPLIAGVLPIAYQYALSRHDPAWHLAASLNRRPDLIAWTPTFAVYAPLLVAAAFGVIRRPPRSIGVRMLVLWPIAALIVYRFNPEFPPHALQGVTLPLAALAVRGWPHGRIAGWAGAVAILAFTIPGLTYFAKPYGQTLRGYHQLYYLSASQHQALNYLAAQRTPGSVLAPMPLALLVPPFTDRAVWAGHQVWTPPDRAPLAQSFFAGEMNPARATAFIHSTDARWVLADCTVPPAVVHDLTAAAITIHRFGCVAAFQISQP